jgi:hypothetical protein
MATKCKLVALLVDQCVLFVHVVNTKCIRLTTDSLPVNAKSSRDLWSVAHFIYSPIDFNMTSFSAESGRGTWRYLN